MARARLTIHQHRSPLHRTRKALADGQLTIGFLGGSITDPRPGHNWPAATIRWFVDQYPSCRVTVENAAIGATGSDLAVFRTERDILARGCDLVFVEYAVNDNGIPTARRNRTREGLLRKLLAADCDIVLTYTFCQDMLAAMQRGTMPDSIAEFESLARHYRLGSVWMGLHALREVERGLLRWEEWLPDGLHPQSRGSLAYAESVCSFLEKALATTEAPSTGKRALPQPRHNRHWADAFCLPLTKAETTGPWALVRWPHCPWIDQVLATSAPGARLTLPFTGRGLALGFDFGRTAAEFAWRIDRGRWQESQRERHDWVGEQGWFRLSVLTDTLRRGKHRLELKVIHGQQPGCAGTNFHLGLIGVIP